MFIWLLLIVGVPLALIVATFIAFRSNIDPFRIIAGASLGLILHILCVYLSIFPMLVMMMAGAHDKSPGEALNWLQRSIYVLIEIGYGLFAFSYCSYLSGRTRPWPLPLKVP